MKTRALQLVPAAAVFVGLLAWLPGQPGLVEPLAAGEQCVGGQCFVTLPAGLNIPWPPRLGESYPDLELIDQTGQLVRLSSFKGSVLLIEPVGMTCAACQAFSGAHRYGPLGGIVPQPGLPSIEELFPRYSGGLSLSDERIVFVQILFYSLTMDAPTPADVRRWAEHFRMDRSKNRLVLAGTRDLHGPVTFNMIPGFHLVDRSFIFRADSTANQRQDLFRHLLPMVRQLVAGN